MRVCITFNMIVVYDTHQNIGSVISIGTALQHVNHYVMGVKKVKNVIHQMVKKICVIWYFGRPNVKTL